MGITSVGNQNQTVARVQYRDPLVLGFSEQRKIKLGGDRNQVSSGEIDGVEILQAAAKNEKDVAKEVFRVIGLGSIEVGFGEMGGRD